jgi:hypothetical protein
LSPRRVRNIGTGEKLSLTGIAAGAGQATRECTQQPSSLPEWRIIKLEKGKTRVH